MRKEQTDRVEFVPLQKVHVPARSVEKGQAGVIILCKLPFAPVHVVHVEPTRRSVVRLRAKPAVCGQ